MRGNRNKEGRYTKKARGLGTVTQEMVYKRAAELALINGRPAGRVLDSDLDEARRELTGQSGLVPTPTAAEQIPEEEREPVPESHGHKAPTIEPSDEQAFAEKLVEEDVEDAEQDQMVEGTRESQRKDRRI